MTRQTLYGSSKFLLIFLCLLIGASFMTIFSTESSPQRKDLFQQQPLQGATFDHLIARRDEYEKYEEGIYENGDGDGSPVNYDDEIEMSITSLPELPVASIRKANTSFINFNWNTSSIKNATSQAPPSASPAALPWLNVTSLEDVHDNTLSKPLVADDSTCALLHYTQTANSVPTVASIIGASRPSSMEAIFRDAVDGNDTKIFSNEQLHKIQERIRNLPPDLILPPEQTGDCVPLPDDPCINATAAMEYPEYEAMFKNAADLMVQVFGKGNQHGRNSTANQGEEVTKDSGIDHNHDHGKDDLEDKDKYEDDDDIHLGAILGTTLGVGIPASAVLWFFDTKGLYWVYVFRYWTERIAQTKLARFIVRVLHVARDFTGMEEVFTDGIPSEYLSRALRGLPPTQAGQLGLPPAAEPASPGEAPSTGNAPPTEPVPPGEVPPAGSLPPSEPFPPPAAPFDGIPAAPLPPAELPLPPTVPAANAPSLPGLPATPELPPTFGSPNVISPGAPGSPAGGPPPAAPAPLVGPPPVPVSPPPVPAIPVPPAPVPPAGLPGLPGLPKIPDLPSVPKIPAMPTIPEESENSEDTVIDHEKDDPEDPDDSKSSMTTPRRDPLFQMMQKLTRRASPDCPPKLHQAEAEIRRLQAELRLRDEEVKHARARPNEYHHGLRRQLEELDKEWRQIVADITLERDELEEKYDEYAVDLAHTVDQLHGAEEQVKHKIAEAEWLRNERERLEGDFTKTSRKAIALQIETADLKRQIAAEGESGVILKTKLKSLEADLQKNQKTMSDITNSLRDVIRHYAALNKELETLKDNHCKQSSTLEQSEKNKSQLVQELEKVRAQIKNLEKQAHIESVQKQQCAKELGKLKNHQCPATSENDPMDPKRELTDLRTHLDQLQTELQECAQDLDKSHHLSSLTKLGHHPPQGPDTTCSTALTSSIQRELQCRTAKHQATVLHSAQLQYKDHVIHNREFRLQACEAQRDHRAGPTGHPPAAPDHMPDAPPLDADLHDATDLHAALGQQLKVCRADVKTQRDDGNQCWTQCKCPVGVRPGLDHFSKRTTLVV